MLDLGLRSPWQPTPDLQAIRHKALTSQGWLQGTSISEFGLRLSPGVKTALVYYLFKYSLPVIFEHCLCARHWAKPFMWVVCCNLLINP